MNKSKINWNLIKKSKVSLTKKDADEIKKTIKSFRKDFNFRYFFHELPEKKFFIIRLAATFFMTVFTNHLFVSKFEFTILSWINIEFLP